MFLALKPKSMSLFQRQLMRFQSSSRENLKVRMNVYYPGSTGRKIIVNQNQSLTDIENLLKEDNPALESVKFLIGDQEISHTSDSARLFLDLSIHHNLKLVLNNQPTTFEFDDQLNTANYFNENNLSGELAQHEVPFQDAQLIQSFIQNYKAVLEKQYPTSQAFTEKQLTEGLSNAIASFSQFNHVKNSDKLANLIVDLKEQVEAEKEKISSLETEARTKSNSVVKKLLALQCTQFGFLFYLTYGLYGWDFTEPVSYLLGLSTEAYIFYYFIRNRSTLNMSLLFEKDYDQQKKIAISKGYSDSTAHLRFLQSKLDMAEYRQAYLNSKPL